MPLLYLSPSTQENNDYVNGGTEKEWMNRLADVMEPYLAASGIQYVRNAPEMTTAMSIRASNQGEYALHLALHTNAAPEGSRGQERGMLVFYYPGSSGGKQAAESVAEGLKSIYPLPNLVRAEPTTAIGEVRRVRAPSVFLELGYHDNADDVAWIESSLDAIARSVIESLTEYFGIPFLEPCPERPGIVDMSWGSLSIRSRPDTAAPILAKAYDGAKVAMVGQWQGWDLIRFGDVAGYVNGDYITLL
ncbi:MAG: N-acetylmuramoyl-L-alanine amidase [Intestinimonas sp.]|jgi:N-acetylmuramoyl-L-alanine amidase|nr:N-acetylmuramoyl-L-alanine amidase [Intestinimonas sp.]